MPSFSPVILYDYAMQFVGTPYRWGGDDPMHGYDCSGFVLECLTAVGLWPHGVDANALGIYNKLRSIGKRTMPAERGALVFFGSSALAITHIGLCISSELMLEAGGGGSKTVSAEKAAEQNAFIRVRPIKYRRDLVDILLPFD